MNRSHWTLLIVAGLLSTALAGCRGRSGTAPPAVRVEIVRAERKTIRQTVERPAQIQPYEETPLYARVPGYVEKVLVDIGDRVRGPRWDAQGKLVSPGQVLVQLSVPDVEEEVRQKAALLAQAEANVAQARATVRVAKAAITSAEAAIAQAAAAVRGAEAEYDRRQSELKRFTQLAAESAVTQKLADETRDYAMAADAARDAARAKEQAARATATASRADLQKAQADLLAAQARVRVAAADHGRSKTMWDFATLRAPLDATITRRNVHTGHLVQAAPQGGPLLMLMRTDLLRLQVDVPEGDTALARPGAEVSVRLPALGSESFSGKITRTAGALDMTTRTLRIEMDIPNAAGKLRPGLYAYATIVLTERRNAIVVPQSAVISEGAKTFCACVEDGKIVRRPITVGLQAKDEVEIVAGLTGDEAVVRANAAGLAAGQTVTAAADVPPKP